MLARLWRKRSPQEAPWIFLHSPGGGAFEESIYSALSDHFPSRRTRVQPLTSSDLSDPTGLADYQLMRSSLPLYRLHQQFPQAQILFYLRDPVSRVAQLFLTLDEPRPDLCDWLGTRERPGYEEDFYSRCLAGPEWTGFPQLPAELRAEILQHSDRLVRNFPGLLLVHPEIQSCCDTLRRTFPGLYINPPQEGSVAEPAALLDRPIRERILAQNELDAMLYSSAQQSRQVPTTQHEIQLTAGIDLKATGCHYLEVFKDGRSFYWTGAESESVVDLPIRVFANSKLTLALEAVTSLDEAVFETLEVRLAGLPLTRDPSSKKDKLIWRGSADVPQVLAAPGGTLPLSISAPLARSFGADQRRLGLALHKVSLHFSGHLRPDGEARPPLALGALLTALRRARPVKVADEVKEYHQTLERTLDALWDNQYRQHFQHEIVREQIDRLRLEWETFQDKHLEHRSAHYLLANFQARLNTLEEMLDAYAEP